MPLARGRDPTPGLVVSRFAIERIRTLLDLSRFALALMRRRSGLEFGVGNGKLSHHWMPLGALEPSTRLHPAFRDQDFSRAGTSFARALS